MSTEEQKLNELTQALPQEHNPFSVPNGYFSTIHTRVMDMIKHTGTEHEKAEKDGTRGKYLSPLSHHARQTRLKIWRYVTIAAVLTGLVQIVGTMLYRQHLNTTSVMPEKNTSMSIITDMEYSDEILDYAMLSNSDIEYYLTSAE